jgi:hypothetical protein
VIGMHTLLLLAFTELVTSVSEIFHQNVKVQELKDATDSRDMLINLFFFSFVPSFPPEFDLNFF